MEPINKAVQKQNIPIIKLRLANIQVDVNSIYISYLLVLI